MRLELDGVDLLPTLRDDQGALLYYLVKHIQTMNQESQRDQVKQKEEQNLRIAEAEKKSERLARTLRDTRRKLDESKLEIMRIRNDHEMERAVYKTEMIKMRGEVSVKEEELSQCRLRLVEASREREDGAEHEWEFSLEGTSDQEEPDG